MKQLICCILAICFSTLVSQSQKYTVSETVKEKPSGETLKRAAIEVVLYSTELQAIGIFGNNLNQ